MPPFPFEPIAFFAAAFILVGLASGLVRAWAAGNHVKRAVETLKQAQARGAAPEQTMQELKKTAMDEMKRQDKVADKHPAVIVLTALQGLLGLGFLAFFFHEWMFFVALDLMATDLGRFWYNVQMGLLAFTGGYILFRLVASLSGLNTVTIGPESPEGNWLSVVADRRSAWAGLQRALLVLSFLTVFASVGSVAVRAVNLSSTAT
ncbi:hypothetical protein EDM68_04890 [Candidatus Uhrbacteria bacterium]|nr:MAG: hypothetical protein EDM68_04890 [Candidatus Uhrbacteria bacterium]